MILYQELEYRYGAAVAQFLVIEIERAAHIIPDYDRMPQERLDRAVQAQEMAAA